MVQHVAEFVEQCHDVFVRQQRAVAAAVIGWWEVADEVTHGQRWLRIEFLADNTFVDPGTVTLAAARKQVGIEAADGVTTGIGYRVIAHVVVPGRNAGLFLEANAVELLGEMKQAANDRVDGEVLAQLFVRERELLLLQLFEPVRCIPWCNRCPGELRKLRELVRGSCSRVFRQLIQEVDDLAGRRRHLRRQGILGVIVETDESGGFVPQCQDLVDVRRVVPRRVGTLVRGARDPGLVERLTQGAALGVAHDGVIGGVVERQQPALAVALARLGRRAFDGVEREPGELGFTLDVQAPGIRCILHVVLEGRLRRGQLLHDLLEARLGGGRKVHARQVEIPECMTDNAFLRGRRIVAKLCLHGGIGALQVGVL